MPKAKGRTKTGTAKSDAQRQREYQNRRRGEFAEMLDHFLDDVEIFTEWKDGKRVVTFDMSPETNAALESIAKARGTTLDDILRGVVDKNLKQAVKLQEVKERYQQGAKQ